MSEVFNPQLKDKRGYDLTGQSFDDLTIIEYAGHNRFNSRMWLARCKCDYIGKYPSSKFISNRFFKCCAGCALSKKCIDLTGQKFGKLTAIKRAKNIRRGNSNRTAWHVHCDCGNDIVVIGFDLTNHDKDHCGCVNKNLGKNSWRWRGFEEISGSYFNRVKKGARERKLPFNVTIKEMWNLFLSQNRKCAITGVDLTFSKRSDDYTANASLDRIDSSKGYVPGNIQWVHKKINISKQDLSDEEFIELCRQVVNGPKANPIPTDYEI